MPRTAKATKRDAKASRRSAKPSKKIVRHKTAKRPVEAKKNETAVTLCSCGCGERVSNPKRLFRAGHDMRALSNFLKVHLGRAPLSSIAAITLERFSKLAKLNGDSRCREVFAKATKTGKAA